MFSKILEKLLQINTWKQLLIAMVIAISSITLYTMWENRQEIYNRVSIPKSKVYYVQRDLEVLELLRELNERTTAMRSYIVEFKPEWDDMQNLSTVQTYGVYEQVQKGISGVSDTIQERPLLNIPIDWKAVYREGTMILNANNENLSPFVRHELRNAGATKRVIIGIYTKNGKLKYGLMVDFTDKTTVDKDVTFILQEYCRILRYYLD